MSKAKYTFLQTTPTVPTKYIYKDEESGKKVVRNGPFPNELVIGMEPEDGGNDAVGQSSTTPVETGNTTPSVEYGSTAIDTRTFKTKDPDKDINMGPGVRSLYINGQYMTIITEVLVLQVRRMHTKTITKL
jgi:hypothetical protein